MLAFSPYQPPSQPWTPQFASSQYTPRHAYSPTMSSPLRATSTSSSPQSSIFSTPDSTTLQKPSPRPSTGAPSARATFSRTTLSSTRRAAFQRKIRSRGDDAAYARRAEDLAAIDRAEDARERRRWEEELMRSAPRTEMVEEGDGEDGMGQMEGAEVEALLRQEEEEMRALVAMAEEEKGELRRKASSEFGGEEQEMEGVWEEVIRSEMRDEDCMDLGN